MSEQDKHQESTEPNIVPKKEQRRCLSCNNIGTRCSFLGCEQQMRFNPEQVKELITFAKMLKQVHVRLVMEGYVIEDGRIYKPKKDE